MLTAVAMVIAGRDGAMCHNTYPIIFGEYEVGLMGADSRHYEEANYGGPHQIAVSVRL